MRKLVAFLAFCTLIIASAHASTMCAADDTIAIVLDPAIGGNGYSANVELSEWSAKFSYGTVFGASACIDVSSPGGEFAVKDLRDSDGDSVTGGERTGQYCWCRMTHPLRSDWVYRYAHPSITNCQTNCPSNCAHRVGVIKEFRTTVFGSIGS